MIDWLEEREEVKTVEVSKIRILERKKNLEEIPPEAQTIKVIGQALRACIHL